MKSSKSIIEIKGSGGMLGLHIYDISFFDQVETELRKLLQRSNSKRFFQGANIVLRTEGNDVSSNEFLKLSTILEEEGDLHLIKSEELPESSPFLARTIISSSEKEKKTNTSKYGSSQQSSEQHTFKNSPAKDESIEEPLLSTVASIKPSTSKSKKKPKPPNIKPIPQPNLELFGLKDVDTLDAYLIRQTLHSGQKIYSKSSIVLLGDVNGGAEIVSDNDIIILGTLRGVAHAGVEGNYQAIIFALKMQPTQLRISDVFSRPSTKDQSNSSSESEIAFVEDKDIIIETCQKFRV